MKYLYILLCAIALSLSAKAQKDTLPAYLQVPYIPPFKIQLADSSWYSKANLTAKKAVLILYFSPDCGHCQLETEELITRMKELKNLQVVMITSKSNADMAFFANHYKLRGYQDRLRFRHRRYQSINNRQVQNLNQHRYD